MQKRWQDWLGLALGILMFLSPWLIGFAGETYAAASAWLLGIATVVLFAVALFRPEHQWEEWGNLALAVLLILAPFALGFTVVLGAAYTHWLLGALIGLDAIWALYAIRGKAHGTA